MTESPSTAQAFPLQWPAGRPRHNGRRTRARFHVKKHGEQNGFTYTQKSLITLAAARDELLDQIRMMGAKLPVISTNLELRRDGLPRGGQSQPNDVGAAVYFIREGKQLCFACDRWDRVEDNIVAIAKAIDALRGIERWGTGEMVAAAFRGFAALPPVPGSMPSRPWHEVMGIPAHTPNDSVHEKYLGLSRTAHPDRGGSDAAMADLNAAYDAFKRERGL